MAAVLELAGVTIRRGQSTLLEEVDWRVEEDERWVVLGPNGAGKTTLVQVCSAQIHPTAGVAGVLGEVMGAVDVFELRPRIGYTSAAVSSAAGGSGTTRSTTTVPPRCCGRWVSRTSPTAPSARSARASASACRSPAR
jgi:ABC-type molybdenum transport system ATPase subunit/photorepair protein PhrA